MNEEQKAAKPHSRVKKAIGISVTVLFVLVFVLLCIAFISRLMGNNNGVLGFHINIIASGSMKPEIEVGDVIISRTYKNQELRIGDVVTYMATSGDKAGELITHEIIKIDDGTVTTKGIAAPTADDPIAKDEIVSVMLYKSFFLKYAYKVISTPWGFALLIVLPLLLTIAGELYSLLKQSKKKKNDQS